MSPEASKKLEPPKKVVLRAYGGAEFEVDVVVASQSGTIKNMIDDGWSVESGVPLPNVEGPVLAKMVEYWKRHVEGGGEEELKEWDKDFIETEKQELLEIAMVAHCLNSQLLFDFCCQAVADTIKRGCICFPEVRVPTRKNSSSSSSPFMWCQVSCAKPSDVGCVSTEGRAENCV